MPTYKVLIADDHLIVRSGIRYILKDILPFAAIDEACNGDEAISFVKKNDYDLIILDINMPDTDSVSLVSNLLVYKEKSRILIFSMNPEKLYAKRFLKLGALGYLHKEAGAEEIKKAVLNVLNGIVYASRKIKEQLHNDELSQKSDNPFEKLSDREIQIARYFLNGHSLTEIKKTLNLHSSTIGTHKIRIFEKLKIKTLVDLAELARIYQLEGVKS